MSNWREKSNELKESLQLRTEPIAYRRLEKAGDLNNIEGVTRLKQGATFCQIKFQARRLGYTVGVASEDNMYKRCKGIHGLRSYNEEDMKKDSSKVLRMPSQKFFGFSTDPGPAGRLWMALFEDEWHRPGIRPHKRHNPYTFQY